MRISVLIVLVFSTLLAYGTDYPIIFVHGQKTPGEFNCGWDTWNNKWSAMTKLYNETFEDYSIYQNNCNKSTILNNNIPTKTMFNFSFYPENQLTESGVISISSEEVEVQCIWKLP